MENITKNYKKFKLQPSKETIDEICNKKKYELQPQQKFLGEFLYENKKVNGLLVYHRIGSGKTCTAINIAEKFKKKLNIVIVLPASLIGNFRDELRTQCPGNNVYININELNDLEDYNPKDDEYKEIIERTDDRIDEYYTIYSYHKFVQLIKDRKIKLNNTLLIIDEIQNMISINGTFYKTLKQIIDKTDKTLKLILLSATPMFDKPVEIALTLNLLRPKNLLPIGNEFDNLFLKKVDGTYEAVNLDKFRELTKNMVSYYRGAPVISFPQVDFKIVKCKMSDFQYKSYLTSLSEIREDTKGMFKDVDLLKLPSDFFLGPRIVSNVAFPNKSIGDVGFSSFKKNYLNLDTISNYSIKFHKIFTRIKKSEGTVFVYSNFKEEGGLKSFITFLEWNGYKSYKTFGEGKKRYAVWSGDETQSTKQEIKHVFNNKENVDGSHIKIMLGSPSIKEGVSLLRLEQIHILEPYWNMSRLEQIMGRGVRFCSHKDMPKSKRVVNIYLYLAVHEKEEETVDQHIWKMALEKNNLISKFEHILKENAIDCNLFHARNYHSKDEKKLICFNK